MWNNDDERSDDFIDFVENASPDQLNPLTRMLLAAGGGLAEVARALIGLISWSDVAPDGEE